MGAIVAVEGLDGAGKATLVAALAREAAGRGASVATRAFPRYTDDVHAALAGEALRGEHGDTAASVHAMALLFALDRRAAADGLRADADRHDVVLVDRWVASNAAYGAARLGEPADGPFVRWVAELEIQRFGVPVPSAHVLVRVPPDVAARRVVDRAATAPGRGRDAFETDAGLQERCAARYDDLAAAGWLAPWFTAPTTAPTTAPDPGGRGAGPDPEELRRTAAAVLATALGAASGSDSSANSDTIET